MGAVKTQQPTQLLEAFAPFEHFSKAMLDAYIVIDQAGRVVKCNQMFSQLTGQTTKQVMRAGSLDELLRLTIKNEAVSIEKILSHQQPIRIDEVHGETASKAELVLILGIYPLIDPQSGLHLGSFVLIRDVTAENKLQDKYAHTAQKSITDPLTGLFTRGYFEDYFSLHLGAAQQLPLESEQRNITVVLIDIDFFKKVNDVHGHLAGDHILRELSQLMSKTFRKTDIVCRYGGEEFLVILPNTDLENAIIPVEKLRLAVEACQINFEGTIIPITISCGIAQVNVAEDEPYPQTIGRADAALYQAKHDGRNRVCLHENNAIKRATK